ncbi:MAG: SDR family oxidoreductase, partial [Deltaproteobacteria bacterium]|nr:SDR family oxidoreductase [Deltaproteobacteria bacterium]
RGAKVVVNDMGGARDGVGSGDAAANKVVDEIKAQGGVAVPNYDNVATAKGGENIVKTALDAFGKVDILINNAGILRDKSFVKMEEDTWDAVVNVHLRGSYCVSRPAFIQMREKGYGRIVMTTSAAGIFGNFGQTNYSAAKNGIVGLANTMKLEGAKYNIKVNVLAPLAGTRLTEDVMPPEVFQRLKVEYVTPVVMYMCSEQCQDTGVIVNAGAGYFSRSAMMTGPGAILTDASAKVPTAEDISDNWAKITSLENPKYFFDANGIFPEMEAVLSGDAKVGPQK